jgi:DNA-binding SARP family transcriptional activator
VYHRGRRLLDERLGIAPGPALRTAYQRVLDAQAG